MKIPLCPTYLHFKTFDRLGQGSILRLALYLEILEKPFSRTLASCMLPYENDHLPKVRV
jgi:hypothetical protein